MLEPIPGDIRREAVLKWSLLKIFKTGLISNDLKLDKCQHTTYVKVMSNKLSTFFSQLKKNFSQL